MPQLVDLPSELLLTILRHVVPKELKIEISEDVSVRQIIKGKFDLENPALAVMLASKTLLALARNLPSLRVMITSGSFDKAESLIRLMSNGTRRHISKVEVVESLDDLVTLRYDLADRRTVMGLYTDQRSIWMCSLLSCFFRNVQETERTISAVENQGSCWVEVEWEVSGSKQPLPAAQVVRSLLAGR